MLLRALILSIFIISAPMANAFVFFNPYASFNIGSTDFDNISPYLDHNNNNYGIEVGARTGLNLYFLHVGVSANMNWAQHDGRRADQNGFFFWEGEGYDQTLRQDMFGGYVAIPIQKSGFTITGEYFKDINGKFTYSDTEGFNPMNTGDRIKGSGYSIGLIKNGEKSKTASTSIALSYRRIVFKNITRNGSQTSFPALGLTNPIESMVTIQYIFNFGL